jgi:hypothetical protein
LSKYLICTIEQYNQGVSDGVQLDEVVSLHSPIYSPDGSEVLVKGIGEMTIDDVNLYISENWIYPEEA